MADEELLEDIYGFGRPFGLLRDPIIHKLSADYEIMRRDAEQAFRIQALSATVKITRQPNSVRFNVTSERFGDLGSLELQLVRDHVTRLLVIPPGHERPFEDVVAKEEVPPDSPLEAIAPVTGYDFAPTINAWRAMKREIQQRQKQRLARHDEIFRWALDQILRDHPAKGDEKTDTPRDPMVAPSQQHSEIRNTIKAHHPDELDALVAGLQLPASQQAALDAFLTEGWHRDAIIEFRAGRKHREIAERHRVATTTVQDLIGEIRRIAPDLVPARQRPKRPKRPHPYDSSDTSS